MIVRIWTKHLNKISTLAILFTIIIVIDYSKLDYSNDRSFERRMNISAYIWKSINYLILNSFITNYSKFFQILFIFRLTSDLDRYYLKILDMIKSIRLFLHEMVISKIQTGNTVYRVEFADLKTFRPSWIH